MQKEQCTTSILFYFETGYISLLWILANFLWIREFVNFILDFFKTNNSRFIKLKMHTNYESKTFLYLRLLLAKLKVKNRPQNLLTRNCYWCVVIFNINNIQCQKVYKTQQMSSIWQFKNSILCNRFFCRRIEFCVTELNLCNRIEFCCTILYFVTQNWRLWYKIDSWLQKDDVPIGAT